MRKKRNIPAILLILLSAFLASCSLIQSSEPTNTGVGKVVIHITDAPFPVKDVKNVFINVDKVEMRVAGGLCKGTQGEHIGKGKVDDEHNETKGKHHEDHDYSNFECDSGYVSVFSSVKPVEIDLLKLQNGITTMLAQADIPVGSYDIIRLHIVDASVVLADTTFKLKVPSCETDGLKIRLDSVLVVKEGETTAEVLLDIDLSQSFIPIHHHDGRKGFMGFIFKPVIRAMNHHKCATIFGTVYEGDYKAIEGALVTILKKDTVITSAITNSKGAYKVISLPEGTYTLKAEKAGYTTVNFPDIKVTVKSEIKKNIQLVQQK
jgi:hypothetical protein